MVREFKSITDISESELWTQQESYINGLKANNTSKITIQICKPHVFDEGGGSHLRTQ